MFKMFKLVRKCSDSVQNVQNFFRIFRQCSESVQTFSEFRAQKLVYSEFLDFVVYAISAYQNVSTTYMYMSQIILNISDP